MAVKEPTGDLKKACWKGYTAVGMKNKNGRKVPNCVPANEARNATPAEYEKSLKDLMKRPDVIRTLRSLKKRDQDSEYDTQQNQKFINPKAVDFEDVLTDLLTKLYGN